MPEWSCPSCAAMNAPRARSCEVCGNERGIVASSPTHDALRMCPFDGALLHANGFCPSADGFPITQRDCPDACPQCRRPLRWDGDCDTCKPPGIKPGHAYTYEPYSREDKSSAHWHLSVRGPQPLAGPTLDQRAALDAAFAAVLSRTPAKRR